MYIGSWNISETINNFIELHYLPTSEAVLASPVSTVEKYFFFWQIDQNKYFYMDIHFTVKLRCHPRGKNFTIVTDDVKHLIIQDCDIELNFTRDYSGQSILNLFTVEGMTAGLNQRVTIVEMSRNGNKFYNYFLFCNFAMRNNLYINNETLSSCWEICFNGHSVLNVGFDQKQFEFFPFYLSKKREDFIFDNRHLDAGPGHSYWCSGMCRAGSGHINRWFNEPYLPIYTKGAKYDFGCFGCSVTRGLGLTKGSEWPALVNLDLGSVVNLAEGSLGADGIFLNLICALKEFKLARVIILWPELNRGCYRWRVDDWHSRVPFNIHSDVPSGEQYNLWHSYVADGVAGFLLKFRAGCLTGRVSRRSQRIIARTVRLLQNLKIPAYYSSWSEETYSYLGALGLGSALLSPFPKGDRGAIDATHPSAHQQRSWYESIKKQIN